ncbi:MAG: Tfp pilus assembly protein FimT/FimU [Blastocatellia bacterium]
MTIRSKRSEHGFTMIEATVAVSIVILIAAFSTPKIINAMRQYRIGMATRQIADLIQRAKVEAVSQNRNVTVRVDTVNNRAGLVIRDASGTETDVQYIPLPQGVRFVLPTMPSGSTLPAPMTGAPTSSSVSFAAKTGSTGIYEQDFNSRGFPAVNAGAIHALYVGSYTTSYAAVTLNSVGGIRTWSWSGSQWLNTRTGTTGN